MEVRDLQKLFERAKDLSGHAEFVVVGSNSVLGVPLDRALPPRMTMSIDVDAYTRNDPGRIFDLEKELGQGSPFEHENGYYLDPVSPALPTLPAGWESRLFKLKLDRGLVFLTISVLLSWSPTVRLLVWHVDIRCGDKWVDLALLLT